MTELFHSALPSSPTPNHSTLSLLTPYLLCPPPPPPFCYCPPPKTTTTTTTNTHFVMPPLPPPPPDTHTLCNRPWLSYPHPIIHHCLCHCNSPSSVPPTHLPTSPNFHCPYHSGVVYPLLVTLPSSFRSAIIPWLYHCPFYSVIFPPLPNSAIVPLALSLSLLLGHLPSTPKLCHRPSGSVIVPFTRSSSLHSQTRSSSSKCHCHH